MKNRIVQSVIGPLFVLAALAAGCGPDGDKSPSGPGIEMWPSWTKNPTLDQGLGMWDARSFCWRIGGPCPGTSPGNRAEWVRDGQVCLRAEDDQTADLGTNVAALSQGVDFGGNVHGDPLSRLRTGDVEAAYIIFDRSDAGAERCSGITGSGNIINFWLEHPEGARWVTDFYFETLGLNEGFGERMGPHSPLVSLVEGVDWYAYQMEMERYPEYWTRTVRADGSTRWVIDLKALLDRGDAFSGRRLSEYRWMYVEVVSENICFLGSPEESVSWQNVHHFEIKVRLSRGR